MFANSQMMGMDFGFPDVCLTPAPPSPSPIPIPYPNIALGPMGVPAAYEILFMCAPAHNLSTEVVMTNGDNAGIATGVASGTVMGPSRHLTGAFTVLLNGMPASRMTSVALQNSTNCPGMRGVPSQFVVLIFRAVMANEPVEGLSWFADRGVALFRSSDAVSRSPVAFLRRATSSFRRRAVDPSVGPPLPPSSIYSRRMNQSGFAAALAPGTVISGKYRVEGLLGKGGMGVVVAARHIDLNQSLAIKVLLPTAAASPEAMTRFHREGRSAAQLTSPHVAKVHDTGLLATGEPYLVMELLRGRDLRALLNEFGRVPLPKAAEWVLQAAHALAEAHKLSIIHRDIKPANLFLADTGVGEHIKVLDFGVSKQLDVADDLTSTMTTVGTPRYMAPEQMRSAKFADARGDIWSLGVVLYELTTGKHPFHGDTVTALCFDVMERTPTPPSHLNPALPAGLDEIVARCLEKNPDDRFRSMEALATALRSVVPELGRLSGLFNAAALDAAGPVSGVTPVPSVERDPTGATRLHPPAGRVSRPGFPAPHDANPTGATRLHPSPPSIPVIPPAVVPVGEVALLDLAGHDSMQSWNTSALARAAAKKERNRLIPLWIGIALGVMGLITAIVVVNLVGRHAAMSTNASRSPAAQAPSAPASSTLDRAQPVPTLPVVEAVGPAPTSTLQASPSTLPPPATSADSPAPSSPSTVAAPPQPPSGGCYYFDERGHKHVHSWCR